MKGSQFERDICKKLTVWLTGNIKPYKFWRTPLSGGLATINLLNKNLSGDIRALDNDGQFLTDNFVIECKTGYPQASFDNFISCKKHKIIDFWNQVLEKSIECNKQPLLIFRKKKLNTYIGISQSTQLKLNEFLNESRYISIKFNKDNFIFFYDFNQFFSKISPETLREIM